VVCLNSVYHIYSNEGDVLKHMDIDGSAVLNMDKTDPTMTSGERTYQIILQKLLKGEFPPGMRLTRRPLAKMLGVSHIPVLEALKRLEQDGLIEYHPHWGAIVSVPTATRIHDVFLLREAVECQIARILADSLSDDQKAQLKKLATELDRIPFEDGDAYRYTEVHYNFHLALASSTGSSSLYKALERNNFLWLMCLQGQTKRPRPPESLNRHIYLVDVFLKGDPQAAEDAMREHIRFGLTGLLQDFKEESVPGIQSLLK